MDQLNKKYKMGKMEYISYHHRPAHSSKTKYIGIKRNFHPKILNVHPRQISQDRENRELIVIIQI